MRVLYRRPSTNIPSLVEIVKRSEESRVRWNLELFLSIYRFINYFSPYY